MERDRGLQSPESNLYKHRVVYSVMTQKTPLDPLFKLGYTGPVLPESSNDVNDGWSVFFNL